jgi:hypothetical protein
MSAATAGYGIVGLLMVTIAYVINIFQISTALGNTLITALFTTGMWLLFDSMDFWVNGSSLLHRAKNRSSTLLLLILIGVFIGLCFDLFGGVLSGLWTGYFPQSLAGAPKYLVSVFFGYGVPILLYYSCYRVILSVIRKGFGSMKTGKIASRKGERKVLKWLAAVGPIMIAVPVILFPFSGEWHAVYRGLMFAFTLIGMWFILEHIEYRRHEKSLLLDMMGGYWAPFVALVLGAFFIGFVWEFLNVLRPAWTYTNLPIQLSIAGVPVYVLLGWIPLFIVYLSFYRAVFKGRDRLW